MERKEIEQLAKSLYADIKKKQLMDMQERMPSDKQGVDFSCNGITYASFIRRLTTKECDLLQTIPDWYNWEGISDTQHFKMLGNGWNVETIKHCWQYLPDFGRPIRVWSLFDGMACGMIALKELGRPVECYISSEIDKYAIRVEKQNFPKMVQVGSVTEIDVDKLIEKYGVPDFLIAGSPCTDMSFSGRMKGMVTSTKEEVYTLNRYLELKSQGFEFDGQSYLFWEFMRILTELRKYNQELLFFFENVEMLDKWERCLSHSIGIRGVHINSALVSAQNRRRIYWSNIKVNDLGNTSLFDFSDDPFELPRYQTDIPQPKDRHIYIDDILQDKPKDNYYLKDDTVSSLVGNVDNEKFKQYLLTPQISVDEALEYMNNQPLYSMLSKEDKEQIARYGYELEKNRLYEKNCNIYKRQK